MSFELGRNAGFADNTAVREALRRATEASAPPWRRWRNTIPRVRWPVMAFQWAIFFSMFGLSPGGSYGGEGSAIRQFFWVMLFALALLGITASPEHFKRITAAVKEWRWHLVALTLFWLFATSSAIWGEFPAVTAKRGALLGLVIFLCVLAAASAVVLEMSLAGILMPPLLSLLIISLLFSAAYPGVAFGPIGWQGMTGHKNIAGQLAAILFISAILLRGQNLLSRKYVRYGIALLALVALGFSKSATSIICLMCALAMLAFLAMPSMARRHRTWVLPIVVFWSVALCLGMALLFLDFLPSPAVLSKIGLDAFGKSDTLTGRTKLWDLVLAQDQYRSVWFGLGYGGFWDSSYGQILYVIQKLGFRPIQAHNGYLDIFNEVGFIGLGLAIILVLIAILALARVMLFDSANKNAQMAAVLLTFILASNFTESSLLRTTSLLNLLFLTAMLVGSIEKKHIRNPVS